MYVHFMKHSKEQIFLSWSSSHDQILLDNIEYLNTDLGISLYIKEIKLHQQCNWWVYPQFQTLEGRGFEFLNFKKKVP